MVTSIELTQGQVALVDDADAEWLNQWKWCASRSQQSKFVAVRADPTTRRLVYMARQILGLSPGDGNEADHLNHDTLDNRRLNLRVVTPGANKRNQPARGGSSEFVGVTWDQSRHRWRAQISIDRTVINLGRYETEREAVAARDRYVMEHATGHAINEQAGV